MIPRVSVEPIIPNEEELSTGELNSSERVVEDIRLDTLVGPLRLKHELRVKSRASFTSYGPNGDFSAPNVLSNLSRQMFGWGFQVSVGKPPIAVWNKEFKESDEYSDLSEDKIRLRVAEAAKSMPSNGRYGRVDTYLDGFNLPRDFARAFLNATMPRAVMVQFNGETEVTAYAMEYTHNVEQIETDIDGEYEDQITVGIRVHAFTNLHCYTQRHYKALCDRILNRSWEDAVEVLFRMNNLESSILLEDSEQEISLD